MRYGEKAAKSRLVRQTDKDGREYNDDSACSSVIAAKSREKCGSIIFTSESGNTEDIPATGMEICGIMRP